MKKVKVALIGPGRWGLGVLILLKYFADVVVVGIKGEKGFEKAKSNNQDDNVEFTTDLKQALNHAVDFTVITLPGQIFRKFLEKNISLFQNYQGTVVLQMKALESATGKRLTEIWDELINTKRRVVVVGPVHSEYLAQGKPISMAISIEGGNSNILKDLLEVYGHPLLKLREQYDLIGVEIGAALKNPIGIMAGILFALGYESLMGDLITRAPFEVSKVIRLKGGKEKTAGGLSHLGDYAATAFSPLSHNRQYGEFLASKSNKEWEGGLVEGVETVKAFWKLVSDFELVDQSTISNSNFPLFRALYGILFEAYSIENSIKELRERETKEEF
jgi:glycerol-3-phosphate dehydrogenase (NAD(P)+)